MKAREWAAKLTAEGSDQAGLLKAFAGEVGFVARQRGDSLNAREGAVREGRAKWLAVCRLAPAYAECMFEQLLGQFAPDLQKAERLALAAQGKARPTEEAKPEGPLPGRELAEKAKAPQAKEGEGKRRTPPPALRIGDLKARARRKQAQAG